MGTVFKLDYVYKGKNVESKNWYIGYTDPTGNWVKQSTGCKIKKDAEDKLREIEGKIARGDLQVFQDIKDNSQARGAYAGGSGSWRGETFGRRALR